MFRVLTNSQMREADAYTINELGISSEELMHRAGVALADETQAAYNRIGAKGVLIVCGTGNNGGDGFVCANELLSRGISVKVVDCKSEHIAEIDGGIIVDCVFGTGLCRTVEGRFAEVIEKINSSGAFVISADIPSGLNGDNGQISGVAVKADITVAIAEYKSGFYLGDGLDYCGKIIKKDIGITCPQKHFIYIYEDFDIVKFYPRRRRNSHKGTYGSVNLIAGSDKYIGAAALSLEGALKSGCGYVKLTSSDKVINSLAAKFPQTIFCEPDTNSDCIAIGMGCGVNEELYAQISFLLKNYGGILIIDADGLNTLAKYGIEILKEKKCAVILTPHIKEFSRLSGKAVTEILANPVFCAQEFSRAYGVTLILKSCASVICSESKTAINIRGNSALAKAGSGDILSGYLAGCVARGLSPFDAAVCATYTLGLAAEIAAEDKTEYCATAQDIIKNLHFAIKRLTD